MLIYRFQLDGSVFKLYRSFSFILIWASILYLVRCSLPFHIHTFFAHFLLLNIVTLLLICDVNWH